MARGRSSGRRADYEWAGTEIALTGLATTTVFQAVATVGVASTIMRIRGRLHMAITAILGVGRTTAVLGLIIASDDAVGVGATALPDPLLDADAEWIWLGSMEVVGFSATLAEQGGAGLDHLEVDTKAMRKVKANEQIVLVVNPGQPTAGVTAAIDGFIRALAAS